MVRMLKTCPYTTSWDRLQNWVGYVTLYKQKICITVDDEYLEDPDDPKKVDTEYAGRMEEKQAEENYCPALYNCNIEMKGPTQ